MHHWNNAHEGHTEHCCLCIPTNVGAHILGFFATLSTIMSIVSAIGLLTGSTDAAGNPVSPAASVSPLISSLLTGYPAVMFLLMVKHNHEDSRKHYAKAYKIMVQITNVLLVLVAIFVLALSLWGFIGTGSVVVLGTGIVSLLGFAFAIFLNVHFNRVVQTYAEHGEGHGHHHQEGYEKH